jgi:hypothetical protein
MPITVQHKIIPFTAAHTASGTPLKINHNIFATSDGAPPPYRTSFPNGANAREANLKHCRPMGMPIIVMLHSIPAKHHANACQKPPHIIQMILPKQPIKISLFTYLIYLL